MVDKHNSVFGIGDILIIDEPTTAWTTPHGDCERLNLIHDSWNFITVVVIEETYVNGYTEIIALHPTLGPIWLRESDRKWSAKNESTAV